MNKKWKLKGIIILKAIFYMTVVRLIFEVPFLSQFSFLVPVFIAFVFVWWFHTMPIEFDFMLYLWLICFVMACACIFKHPYRDHEIYFNFTLGAVISIILLYEVFRAALSHMQGDDQSCDE